MKSSVNCLINKTFLAQHNSMQDGMPSPLSTYSVLWRYWLRWQQGQLACLINTPSNNSAEFHDGTSLCFRWHAQFRLILWLNVRMLKCFTSRRWWRKVRCGVKVGSEDAVCGDTQLLGRLHRRITEQSQTYNIPYTSWLSNNALSSQVHSNSYNMLSYCHFCYPEHEDLVYMGKNDKIKLDVYKGASITDTTTN